MARSLQEQLDAIDLAIQRIEEGAQEFYIGSRRVRAADIAALYKQRTVLQQQVDNSSIGFATVAQMEIPS